MSSGLSEREAEFVREAARYLEDPNFLVRATDLLGQPIEKGIRLLPSSAQEAIGKAVQTSLEAGLKLAVLSLGRSAPGAPAEEPDFGRSLERASASRLRHGVATALTGAVGGFFGLPALAVELPLTTTILLRSIAGVAAELGEDLGDRQTQLDCLSVFALGSPTRGDDAVNSAYYGARIALAQLVRDAAAYLAARSHKDLADAFVKGGAPVLARLVATLSSRFHVVVTQKFVAQAVPVVGAAAGGALNVLFTSHFNSVARYHFGLKRLEKTHGPDAVRRLYEAGREKP